MFVTNMCCKFIIQSFYTKFWKWNVWCRNFFYFGQITKFIFMVTYFVFICLYAFSHFRLTYFSFAVTQPCRPWWFRRSIYLHSLRDNRRIDMEPVRLVRHCRVRLTYHTTSWQYHIWMRCRAVRQVRHSRQH